MKLKERIKDFLSSSEKENPIGVHLSRIQDGQDEANARLDQIQSDLKENSRALATLAIIQARLLNEISEIISEKEKKKAPAPRKNSGPEFTN